MEGLQVVGGDRGKAVEGALDRPPVGMAGEGGLDERIAGDAVGIALAARMPARSGRGCARPVRGRSAARSSARLEQAGRLVAVVDEGLQGADRRRRGRHRTTARSKNRRGPTGRPGCRGRRRPRRGGRTACWRRPACRPGPATRRRRRRRTWRSAGRTSSWTSQASMPFGLTTRWISVGGGPTLEAAEKRRDTKKAGGWQRPAADGTVMERLIIMTGPPPACRRESRSPTGGCRDICGRRH